MRKNFMFVAINKDTGEVMNGNKGQAAFITEEYLRRSIGQTYSYRAMKAGVKPKDLYHIIKIRVNVEVHTPNTHSIDVAFTGVTGDVYES